MDKAMVIGLIVLVFCISGYSMVVDLNTNFDKMPLGSQSDIFYPASGETTEEELINILQSGDYEQKIEAAKKLAEIGTERAVEPLIKAIISDSEYVRVGAAGYPDWKRGVLANIAEGALVAIGHAIKKPAVEKIISFLDYRKLPGGDAAFIPLCRVLGKVGGEDALYILGNIARYERYYPAFRNAARQAAEEIETRLARKDAYNNFLKEQGLQFKIDDLSTVLSKKEFINILGSLKDELIETYALNNSGKLGELLTQIFSLPTNNLSNISWVRGAGRDPMGNIYPADIIEFKTPDGTITLKITRQETTYGFSQPIKGAITSIVVYDQRSNLLFQAKPVLTKSDIEAKTQDGSLEPREGIRVPFIINGQVFIPGNDGSW